MDTHLKPAIWITAAVLASMALAGINLRRGCQIHDSPYAEFGCASTKDTDVAQLRTRIGRNPADTEALKLMAARVQAGSAGATLATLESLAPHDPDVLQLRAADALSRQDWAAASPPLAELVEHHQSEAAARALASIVGGGHWKLLLPLLHTHKQLLHGVLGQLGATGVPARMAGSLVQEALRQHALDDQTAGEFLSRLREQGNWVDAFAVWTAQHDGHVDVLYNGSFDQPFVGAGFDWEVVPQALQARAGVAVERIGEEPRDMVLQVRLNGRRFSSPLVRQYVLLGPGTYRMRGEYNTRRLRLEGGFAWVARCLGSGQELGRSAELADSGRSWRSFEFEFKSKAGCEPIVSLQLETATPLQAEEGGVGEIEFDAFSLLSVPESGRTAMAR